MNEGIDLQKRPFEIEIVLSHKRKNQPFIEEVLALSASIQRIIIFLFFHAAIPYGFSQNISLAVFDSNCIAPLER